MQIYMIKIIFCLYDAIVRLVFLVWCPKDIWTDRKVTKKLLKNMK